MTLMTNTVVLYDLDSTLRDSRQRHHLSPAKDSTKTWHDYSMAAIHDTPMIGPIQSMLLHHRHHQVHILSGSNDSAREVAVRWLTACAPWYDHLQLRADGDTTENGEYKAAYINGLKDRGLIPVLMYEDWPPAADTIFRLTGVPVVVVNPCYPCENCGIDQVTRATAGQVDNIGGGL
jgi:hypothetical protein